VAVAKTLKVRVVLALGYGCGLRAIEVVRLRVGDIDSAQGSIIRVVQGKGRKDRNVMLSEVLALLTGDDQIIAATGAPLHCRGGGRSQCGLGVRFLRVTIATGKLRGAFVCSRG
jgi:Phage integrase family